MMNPYVLHQIGKERHSNHLKEVEAYRLAALVKNGKTPQDDGLIRKLAGQVQVLILKTGKIINREIISPI